MSKNYFIKVTDNLLGAEINGFIFNHPTHTITAEISSGYTGSYRSNIRWDFGDGTIINAPTATHYYKNPGNYQISATFYDKTSNEPKNNIIESASICVKEVVPTELTFSNLENTWETHAQDYISKNIHLGEIQISVNNLINEPKISATRRWKDAFSAETNYFEINSNAYYHLERYYAFLEETAAERFIDSSSLTKTFLKPVTEYSPQYITLYGYLEKDAKENSVILRAYVIGCEKEINFKPYASKDGARKNNFSVINLDSLSELPEEASEIGKIGFAEIWYKNDFPSVNELIFEIKREGLTAVDETTMDLTYLNIPNLGFTFETLDNYPLQNCKKVLSANGLYKEKEVDGKINSEIAYAQGWFRLWTNTNTWFFYIAGHEPIQLTEFAGIAPIAMDWCELINSSEIPYTASYREDDDFTVYIKADNPGNEYCLPFGIGYLLDDSESIVRDKWQTTYSGETLAIETPTSDTDGSLTVDKYLENNFYKDYKVEGILCYFIENDKLDTAVSWNLYKGELSPEVFYLSASENCLLEETKRESYYRAYNFTPSDKFSLLDEKKTVVYTSPELTTFEDILIPTEKYTEESLDDVLKTYMSHPMFQETDNLKTFLKDVLGQNNLFQYILTKGNNFVDDYANIKTCYIDSLLSMYSMMDEDIKLYDIDSFEKVRELKDLMRILSMNYSVLFGNIIDDEYDIKINSFSNGKNVSDKIDISDTIYCDEKWNIIGLCRDGEIFFLKEKTPFVIVKDNFTLKTRLASFYNIETTETDIFDDRTEEWRTENRDFINSVAHVYKFHDYNYRWGWSLNLPDEVEFINNKEALIDNYYSFYLFNPVKSQKRKYNFLEESSIPKGADGKQLSVEEWNEDFGYTYRCLMKILVDKLIEN